MEQKKLHSKMDQLWYSRLLMQEYLKCDKLDSWEAKAVFNYRTRMAKYRDNYKGQRGQAPCPLCNLHLDFQNLCFQCPSVRENVKLKGKYLSKTFGNRISKELAKTVLLISKYRERYLEERQIEVWRTTSLTSGNLCTQDWPDRLAAAAHYKWLSYDSL